MGEFERLVPVKVIQRWVKEECVLLLKSRDPQLRSLRPTLMSRSLITREQGKMGESRLMIANTIKPSRKLVHELTATRPRIPAISIVIQRYSSIGQDIIERRIRSKEERVRYTLGSRLKRTSEPLCPHSRLNNHIIHYRTVIITPQAMRPAKLDTGTEQCFNLRQHRAGRTKTSARATIPEEILSGVNGLARSSRRPASASHRQKSMRGWSQWAISRTPFT